MSRLISWICPGYIPRTVSAVGIRKTKYRISIRNISEADEPEDCDHQVSDTCHDFKPRCLYALENDPHLRSRRAPSALCFRSPSVLDLIPATVAPRLAPQ